MKNCIYLFVVIGTFILSICDGLAYAMDMKQVNNADYPVHLRILAGPERGQWYTMAESMAKILSQEVAPSTYRKGGGVVNLERIDSNLGDVAFSLTSLVSGAASDIPEYAQIPTKNVRIIANVYPQVFYFLIRSAFAKKHGIKTLEDLMQLKAPVRLALLKKGTASEFFMRLLFKYGYSTDYAALRQQGWSIFFNNYAETVDNFVSGNLDCFAYTAGTLPPLLVNIQHYTKFTLLGLGQDTIDTMTKRFSFTPYPIDSTLCQGVTEPVITLSDFTCMVVRKELPDDLVYRILDALWKNRQEVSANMDGFETFSPQIAVPQHMALHPGAQRFWDRLQE